MHLREKYREGQTSIPLVEATVEFVKAFSARTMEEGGSLVNKRGMVNGYTKGRGNRKEKEKERDRDRSDKWEWGAESLLPIMCLTR